MLENEENEDAAREYEREYDMQALFRHAHLKTQGYYSVSKIDVTILFDFQAIARTINVYRN